MLAMREERIPLLTLDKNVFHGGAYISLPRLGRAKSGSILTDCTLLQNEALFYAMSSARSYGVVVSISGCDPLDPGSTPGSASIFFLCRVHTFACGIRKILIRNGGDARIELVTS